MIFDAARNRVAHNATGSARRGGKAEARALAGVQVYTPGRGSSAGVVEPELFSGQRRDYNTANEAPMNVQPRVQMDKDAFLAWAQGREGRFELVERHVVMMVGGSETHALIASQFMRALWARIDVKKWVVLGSDLAVDVGPGSLRYPDAIVDSVGGQRALTATAPILIAEVLAPSSATRPRSICGFQASLPISFCHRTRSRLGSI